MGRTNNGFVIFFFFFFSFFYFLKNADTHQLNRLQFYFGYQKIKRKLEGRAQRIAPTSVRLPVSITAYVQS